MRCIKTFAFVVKDGGTLHLITCHEGTEGKYRYNSTLSLLSALESVVS